MKLSLVVPCYNEAENVLAFQEATINAFKDCGYDFEIIYIDDGSRDATFLQLNDIFQKQRCPVKVVRFSRNFGKDAGIYAGLKYAAGEYVTIIDADLQQRPELVLDMINMMDDCLAYEVDRTYEFAPIKNKTGVDSVDTARELLKKNGVEL